MEIMLPLVEKLLALLQPSLYTELSADVPLLIYQLSIPDSCPVIPLLRLDHLGFHDHPAEPIAMIRL